MILNLQCWLHTFVLCQRSSTSMNACIKQFKMLAAASTRTKVSNSLAKSGNVLLFSAQALKLASQTWYVQSVM